MDLNFYLFFTRDQNPNSPYLQGPKAYINLKYILNNVVYDMEVKNC